MITAILFAVLGLQPQAELQTQFNDLRSRVGDLNGQFGDLRQQLNDLNKGNERTRTEIEKISNCAAEVQWLPLSSNRAVDPQMPFPISLFSSVSKPDEACLNAEVRITANYYDANGAFVCSGSVAVPQSVNVQNHLFEFQPIALQYFLKWRNGQTWDRSTFQTLRCYDYEGIENRDPAPAAASLKLFATVLPKRGGIATAEITLTLPRPTQPPQARPQIPRIF